MNPDYDSTFVFTNDFPAMLPNAPDLGRPLLIRLIATSHVTYLWMQRSLGNMTCCGLQELKAPGEMLKL